jgi:nucleoside-diphosphate-sugar epimerase
VDYIAFTVTDIERDLRLFRGKTDQFVFISSASAYQKPVRNYIITERTPLENPYWEYSRNKIACEDRLLFAYLEEGFPATIIRPSHTYGLSQIPLFSSWQQFLTVIDRMKRDKKLSSWRWDLAVGADVERDFAKGLVGLLGNKRAIGEVFQITSDQVLSCTRFILKRIRPSTWSQT